jgi:hypothetical protein
MAGIHDDGQMAQPLHCRNNAQIKAGR